MQKLVNSRCGLLNAFWRSYQIATLPVADIVAIRRAQTNHRPRPSPMGRRAALPACERIIAIAEQTYRLCVVDRGSRPPGVAADA
jgi:hypothetical protein